MTDTTPASPSDLGCEATFRGIVGDCAIAIDAALAIFLGSDDETGPHKARVALRRLTTCLDAFAPILRRKQAARLRKVAKTIFRDLGQVRDSDVYVTGRKGEAGEEDRRRRNARLRDAMRKRLRRDKAVAFPPRLQAQVQPGGALFRRGKVAVAARQGPVLAVAAQALDRAWQRCLRYGASVAAIPERDRHEFRKDMKSLRYLAEFFADLYPGLDAEPFRSDFRRIQDALGVLNDYAVLLALDKRKRPDRLPPDQTEALAEAEATWQRLFASRLPWRAEA
ncbi:CHAD domain-containing protein [Rhodobacter sp. Har01]|uniref:CHAD domain-containing protein n=1 Tax=Rhodobacter sp. Har01 TaxID=2883999 RepID=UPI001D08FB27|nr:CHAD domain-containing protein [Rhodobacter sp. Har01]MCB6176737.1 CHAD domain-containing protein [Rhodobacter sp. Har01]